MIPSGGGESHSEVTQSPLSSLRFSFSFLFSLLSFFSSFSLVTGKSDSALLKGRMNVWDFFFLSFFSFFQKVTRKYCTTNLEKREYFYFDSRVLRNDLSQQWTVE